MTGLPYARLPGGPPRGAPSTRIAFSVPVLITSAILAANFLYQAAFNFLGDALRSHITAALTLAVLGCVAVSILLRFRLWRLIALFSCVLLLAIWSLGAGYGLGDLPVERAVRYMVPILFAVWILEHRETISTGLLLAMTGLLIALAVVVGLFWPQEYLAGIPRLAPFTGKSDVERNTTGGLHASAYVASMLIIILHQLRLLGRIAPQLSWAGIAVLAALMLGWQVATPILMLFIYFLAHVASTRRLAWWQKAAVAALIVLCAGAGYVLYEMQRMELRGGHYIGIENLGSGRIGTWLGRLEIIAARDPLVFLVGTGPGSDLFTSVMWGQALKVSHNEFLTLVIESGLLGLLVMIGTIVYLCLRFGRTTWPLLLYLLAGSAVSNALILRPLLFCLFWVAVALAALRADRAAALAAAARRRGRPPQRTSAPSSSMAISRPPMVRR